MPAAIAAAPVGNRHPGDGNRAAAGDIEDLDRVSAVEVEQVRARSHDAHVIADV